MAKILVVDDDELIRNLLRALLESQGHDVIEAANGDMGVAISRAERPDLIILDMNMPAMTGWEVMPLLRTHPNTKNIPIVALTADTTSNGQDEAHLAGCDRYITKPIDTERLIDALDGLIA